MRIFGTILYYAGIALAAIGFVLAKLHVRSHYSMIVMVFSVGIGFTLIFFGYGFRSAAASKISRNSRQVKVSSAASTSPPSAKGNMRR